MSQNMSYKNNEQDTKNGVNPFMAFLPRNPVPEKPIDEQKLIADLKGTNKNSNISLAIFAILLVVSIIICITVDKIRIFALIFTVALLIAAFAFAIINTKKEAEKVYTKHDYKVYVLKQALSSKVDNINYDSNIGLPEKVYNNINVISQGNKYHSEDFLTGRYHNIYFMQCDLLVQHHENFTHTYFKGRWITINSPKRFDGTVTVVDNGYKYGIKKDKALEKIEMENSEFNRMFTVNASNEQLAYYLLTPQLMERLMQIRQTAVGDVTVCFKDGVLHIGINNGQDSFEPSYEVLDIQADVQKFQREFTLVSDLIEALKFDRSIYIQQNEVLNQASQSKPEHNDSAVQIQGGKF